MRTMRKTVAIIPELVIERRGGHYKNHHRRPTVRRTYLRIFTYINQGIMMINRIITKKAQRKPGIKAARKPKRIRSTKVPRIVATMAISTFLMIASFWDPKPSELPIDEVPYPLHDCCWFGHALVFLLAPNVTRPLIYDQA